ncbi:MAG: hypothetical protein R3C60_03860 [Parvularculaceae bacterium]
MLTLEPDQQVTGSDYKIIKLTLADGSETYLYFNSTTWMNERRLDNRALHTDLDTTEKAIENRYYDFKR